VNLDETSINSEKRFKCLTFEGKLPITEKSPRTPHLTASITVSAIGYLFKPFLIMPKMKSLKSLSEFAAHCHFSTSLTGWMNEDLFLAWSMNFACEVSLPSFICA
jgi:hypothetical protein